MKDIEIKVTELRIKIEDSIKHDRPIEETENLIKEISNVMGITETLYIDTVLKLFNETINQYDDMLKVKETLEKIKERKTKWTIKQI